MSSQQKSWQQIDALCQRLYSLEHAQSMLHADEAINMPAGGGEARADSVSTLAAIYHDLATAPEITDWIEAAKSEVETSGQKAALTEFSRLYRNKTCLPSEFVARQTAASMRSEQVWRKARGEGDWKSFLPALEELLRLAREEADMRSTVLGLSPYDALMDQFDPGNRAADITPVFDSLKSFLKDFLPQAIDAQEKRLADNPLKPFSPPFTIEAQKNLGLAGMKALGFDFEHGRLDVSHHPFCGGVPSDVRMTTRYRTDEFLTSFMGVLHECGHALYEQGLPRENAHWPSHKARGMSLHESQSMFIELQVARQLDFWVWALPLVREHMGIALEGWTPQDMLAHINKVEPGLIRVDADEVTYPLHIILRYEFEQQLINGQLAPKDLPEAWNAKMVEYLGLSTIDNIADGPMQDVHWPAGLFGYFPSYALGAMTAAQQWATMAKQMPDIGDNIRRGDFEPLNAWRRENIWHKASTASTPEIIEAATGEPLNAEHFKQHLKSRYL